MVSVIAGLRSYTHTYIKCICVSACMYMCICVCSRWSGCRGGGPGQRSVPGPEAAALSGQSPADPGQRKT